jgi:hypothetical protein
MTFGGTLPATSNLASWSEQIQFLDSETSEPMSLVLALDIIVTIAAPRCHDRLVGSLVNGEVVLEPDFLSCTVSFTRSQMQSLAPRTYEIGCRVIFEDDRNEKQMALGFLPVVEGL